MICSILAIGSRALRKYPMDDNSIPHTVNGNIGREVISLVVSI